MCTIPGRSVHLPYGSENVQKRCSKHRYDLRGAIGLWHWDEEVSYKEFEAVHQVVEVSQTCREIQLV